jgi:hypothetical protein
MTDLRQNKKARELKEKQLEKALTECGQAVDRQGDLSTEDQAKLMKGCVIEKLHTLDAKDRACVIESEQKWFRKGRHYVKCLETELEEPSFDAVRYVRQQADAIRAEKQAQAISEAEANLKAWIAKLIEPEPPPPPKPSIPREDAPLGQAPLARREDLPERTASPPESVRFEVAKRTQDALPAEGLDEIPQGLKGTGPIITRKFTVIPLSPEGIPGKLNLPPELFPLFQMIVNRMIKLGLNDAVLQAGLTRALQKESKIGAFVQQGFPGSLFQVPSKIHPTRALQDTAGLRAAKVFYTIMSQTPALETLAARCEAGTLRVLRQSGPLALISRVWWAAAQVAYFAVRECRRQLAALPVLIQTLQGQPDVAVLLDREFPARDLCATVREALIQAQLGLTPGQLTQVALANWCRHIWNQVHQELTARHKVALSKLLLKVNLSPSLQDQLQDWLKGELEPQLKAFLTTLARRLTQRLKRVQRALTAGRADFGKDPLDATITTILAGRSLQDLELREWHTLKQQWREARYAALKPELHRVNSATVATVALKGAHQGLTPARVLQVIRTGRPRGTRLAGASSHDFLTFLEAHVQAEAERRIAALVKPHVQPFLHAALQTVLQQVQQGKPAHIPRFTKQTIPLGIVDTQMYEAPILRGTKPIGMLKLWKRGPDPRAKAVAIPFTLHTPDRFQAFAEQQYVQGQGTLHRKGTRLILAIPFQRTAETPPAETPIQPHKASLVTTLDLGLKSLATLSVALARRTASGSWVRAGPEQARYFLDPRYFTGKRTAWLLKKASEDLKFHATEQSNHQLRNWKARRRRHKGIPMGFNWKRQLTQLQTLARRRQAAVAAYKTQARAAGINYRQKLAYWRLRREWKQAWQKLHHLHEEMACQVATRVVAICQHQQSRVLRMEDLAWARHTAKWQAGYFLTTWQVHWFFSRIQSHIWDLASRIGLQVELVNPRNTSRQCSRCGSFGERRGKVFVCPYCGLQLDADLNAARNILTAPISVDATASTAGVRDTALS